ncbi:MAG: hypothetical protein ABL952_11165 [Pyrinomonadaceae bacterium]
MKVCPTCNVHYDDDTLSFCLDDGTPLTFASQSDTPTAFITDTELVTRVRSGGTAPDPRFMDSQVTHVGSLAGPPPPKSRTALAVVLTAVGMIAVFGVIAVIGMIVYLNQDRPVVSNLEPNKNSSANLPNTNPATIPTPVTSPPANSPGTNVPTPTVNQTPPPIDEPAVRSEVSRQIYSWKAALESRDLNTYMGNYAGTLDYYTKRGASYSFVRADKARAFASFNSMSSEISNMSVSTSADGQTATAVFDKAWTFSGNKTTSGKVRSQLIFRRTNGRWLIISERDLKVYYVR